MKKSRVAENLFLVLQLGISMIVPILLCTAAGYFIDKKFGTHWMIPLIILGVLSGGVSVWTLVKKELIVAKKEEDIPEWQKKAFAVENEESDEEDEFSDD
ncbi:MAG TPA: F0F1-ATPase subunit [Lachnospiraceae bacterium]|nr:F0F1-ATPase subunit [Lachnospiraceae bacterium]